MREYLAVAVEAYNLAATPQPLAIFQDTVDECEALDAPRMPTTSRKTLLDLSIDIKRIYTRFMMDVYRRRGPGGVDRFTTWVKVGYIEQFHSEHREQVREDRKRLRKAINEYKSNIPPY